MPRQAETGDPRSRSRRNLTAPWTAEFRDQLKAAATTQPQPVLRFTVFPQLDERLAGKGLYVGDVMYELRQGIVSAESMGTQTNGRRRYRLLTGRLEVRLHTEPWGSDARRLLVVLDLAFPRKPVGTSEWHVGVVPSDITLHQPSEGISCDIDGLVVQTAGLRRLLEADHTLTKVRLTPRRHTELRDTVRRRYGSLRTLLELAKQRVTVGDQTSLAGTVMDGVEWFGADHPKASDLVVRLDGNGSFQGGDDATIAVWAAGDHPRTADRLNLAELLDGVLVLSFPDDERRLAACRRRFPAGTSVVVSEAATFRYSRHMYALTKFLSEQTAGNWTSLATLLCEPGNLTPPVNLPEIKPHRRPLNDEQRHAVAGALAAPHAFFVQGPPGTGKTQVIAETVSRLVARGERVLLTAPTHVAVDEVLRRLADEPGVLPLRSSYNDKYVAKDVQRFTKRGYEAMVATEVRTPATSKVPQWRTRLGAARAELDALAAWGQAGARHRPAEQAVAAARQFAEQRASTGGAALRASETDLTRYRLITEGQQDIVSKLDAQARLLAERRQGLEPGRSGFSRLLDKLGIGVVGRIRLAERRLWRRRAAAAAQERAASASYEQQWRTHNYLTVEFARCEREDRDRIAEAERGLFNVHRQRADAAERLDRLGGRPTSDSQLSERIEPLRREVADLAARLDVQQFWFELTGATGDESQDHKQAEAVVRKALSSAVNLVCSTTTGFGGAKDLRDLDYDTLIVDEASKVTGAEFLIPARRARRWILVGDEKQLPPYVESDDEHHIHALAAIHLHERDPRYSIRGAVEQLAALWNEREDAEQHPFRIDSVEKVANRLLSKGTWATAHRDLYAEQIRHLDAASTDSGTVEQRLLAKMHEHLVASFFAYGVSAVDRRVCQRLIEQRRMPAAIAELVREPVYGGDYLSPCSSGPAADDGAPQPLLSPSFPKPVVFLDTTAQPWPWDELPPNETSFLNQLEAKWVKGVCRRWEKELRDLGVPGRTSVSVLSFYSAQARLIRQQLGHPRYKEFKKLDFKVVDSVDRIQGQESDLVIISFCRTFGKPKQTKTSAPRRDRIPPPGYARWLQNINRLNVACTRARRSLILVGHGPTLRTLNGVAAAEGFYRNLFGLDSKGGLAVVVDWEQGGRSR